MNDEKVPAGKGLSIVGGPMVLHSKTPKKGDHSYWQQKELKSITSTSGEIYAKENLKDNLRSPPIRAPEP